MPSACFILCDYGTYGLEWRAAAPERASRDAVTADILSGQIDDEIVTIIEANPAEGWSRDITEAVAGDIYDQCIRKGADPSRAAIDFMSSNKLKIRGAA